MTSFDRDHFEALYAKDADPWQFRSSAYEKAKYDTTLNALARARYRHVLELGCSIGVLTCRLAERCDRLTAVDTSEAALAQARQACQQPHVILKQAHLPEGDWGSGFDLIVLSEVLYYLESKDLERLAIRLQQVATRDAEFIAVHWLGETNYPLSGDAATDILQGHLPVEVLKSERHRHYRLDAWRITS